MVLIKKYIRQLNRYIKYFTLYFSDLLAAQSSYLVRMEQHFQQLLILQSTFTGHEVILPTSPHGHRLLDPWKIQPRIPTGLNTFVEKFIIRSRH